MHIFKIDNKVNNIFKAKGLHNNVPVELKNALYADIDKYMNKRMTKEEYIKAFNKNTGKIMSTKPLLKQLTLDEKIYISDVKTTIDMADSIKAVSDKELILRMNELLQSRK